MKYQQSQDGRVGLRRQFQVLVRKGMGSNPILDKLFFSYLEFIYLSISVLEKNMLLTILVWHFLWASFLDHRAMKMRFLV